MCRPRREGVLLFGSIFAILVGLATVGRAQERDAALGIPELLPSNGFPAFGPDRQHWDPMVLPASGLLSSRISRYEELPVPPDVLPLTHYQRLSILGVGDEKPFTFDYVFMGRAGVDAPATNVKINEIGVAYRRRLTFGNQHLLTLRPFFDVLFFSGPGGGLDIPDQVYKVAIELQADFRINDQLGISLGFTPGFWTDFVKVNLNDIRLPVHLVGTVRVIDSVMVAAGLYFTDNIRSNLLPTGGVIWSINNRTDLELLYPRSRLVYHLHEELQFYTVAEYLSTTYHIRSIAGDEDFEYRDLHILLGSQVDIWDHASYFVELGSTLHRRFRFDRQLTSDIKPAFFLRLGTRF